MISNRKAARAGALPRAVPRAVRYHGVVDEIAGHDRFQATTLLGDRLVPSSLEFTLDLLELGLHRLASRFPADQELAYAESLSATRFLLRTFDADATPDDPSPLVRRLAEPRRGAPLRNLLHDRPYMRGFERAWRDSITTLWTFAAVITGGGLFWIGAAWLFLFAYWRKRKRSRRR